MVITFDLDGTLIDSSRDLAEAVSELVQGHGAPPLDVATVVAMVGDGAPMLVRRALERSGLDPATPGALPRFLEIYDRRLMDHTVAYEGMHEVLSMLAHVGPLAVLTNKPLAPSLAILEALGLRGFFSAVLGGDGPHARKPHPGGLLALARLGGDEPSAILVGDSPADAQTAEAAGYPFGWARYGFGAGKFGDTPPRTPHVVNHPRELVKVIAALRASLVAT